MGSLVGVALAAVIMIGGTEILRELDILKAVFGNDFEPTQYRMLVFGFAMVLIMIWRPRGLIATREPSVLLGGRHRPTLVGGRANESAQASLAQERQG
jgi:branched-chain amino acid transport system permease protein